MYVNVAPFYCEFCCVCVCVCFKQKMMLVWFSSSAAFFLLGGRWPNGFLE